jgi:hypothetical protein
MSRERLDFRRSDVAVLPAETVPTKTIEIKVSFENFVHKKNRQYAPRLSRLLSALPVQPKAHNLQIPTMLLEVSRQRQGYWKEMKSLGEQWIPRHRRYWVSCVNAE